jgi:hypothetical protein
MKSWGLPVLLSILLASAALMLAGCTVAPVTELPPAGVDSPLAPPAGATPELAATPIVSDDGADSEEQSVPSANVQTAGIPGDILNSVLDDAAQKLGVEPDALVVTKAEAVTWPDGSLGCPEPGMFYTQALVDGYWIVVEAGGQAVDYRVSGGGNFRICERPQPGSRATP